MTDKQQLEVALQDGTLVRGRASDFWAMSLYASIIGEEVSGILKTGDFVKAGEVVEQNLRAAASKELDEARKEIEAKLASRDPEFAQELKDEIAALSKRGVKAIAEEAPEDESEAPEELPTKAKRKASAKENAELYREQAIANLIERASRYKAFNKISISLLGRAFFDRELRSHLLDALCSVFPDLPSDQYSIKDSVFCPQISDLMSLLIAAISAGFPDLEESK